MRDSLRKEEKESWLERILGNGDFVDSVLRETARDEKQAGISFRETVQFVKRKIGMSLEDNKSRSRIRKVVKARCLYCYLAKEKGGISGAQQFS